MKNTFQRMRRPAILALLAATLLPACGDSGSSGTAPAAGGMEDLAVPAINITSPTSEEVYEVNASPVDLSGTAADAIGLASVTWANSTTSATGTASGLAAWTASVWLAPGPNTITFTATDGAGNTAQDKITVILRAYSLRGWGKNNRGQLGDGTLYDRNRPVTLPYLQGVKQVACGLNHTAVLLTDGTLRAWGDSSAGQVGSLAPGATNPTPVLLSDSDPILDIKNIVQIACTDYMTVALDASGIAWIWGGFDFPWDDPTGAVPVQLSPFPWSQSWFLINNVKSVAAGSNHALLLLTDGSVRVMGRNLHGQHGAGDSNDFYDYGSIRSPLLPVGVRARAVYAGGDSSAIITDNGSLYVWGRNDLNQLGIVNASPVTTPVQQTLAVQDWNSVSFSSTHGAGIRAGNQLFTWGSNLEGQLGHGNTIALSTPTAVTGRFIGSVAVGVSCTVAVAPDGTVITAGINTTGTLGTGSAAANSPNFVSVSGLTGIVKVDIGAEHIVALKGDSPVIGFGLDFDGQLGTDRSISTSVATSPIGISTAVGVAAGLSHTLIRLSDGTGVGFGFNRIGEIGDGTTSARATAVQVVAAPLVPMVPDVPLTDIAQFSGGQYFSLARLTNGDVWSWGINEEGQLGNGNFNDNVVPTVIASPPGMTPVSFIATGIPRDIDSGGAHSLAVGAGGTVWSWGHNQDGQLGNNYVSVINGVLGVGNGGTTYFPFPASSILPSSVTVSLNFVLQGAATYTATTSAVTFVSPPGVGVVVRANYLFYNDTATPTAVGGITSAVSVAAGSRHSMALLEDGSVLAWGNNSNGQLGDGTTSSRPTPLPVTGLSGVVAIAAGGEFSLALLSNGTVRAWGNNAFGQLGTGNRINSLVAVQVGFLTGVTAISGGGSHGLALLSDQTVRAWGGNEFGQIGDSTLTDALFPTDVLNVRGVVQLSAGVLHSMAVLRDGSVRGWGGNIFGNLGDGTLVVRTRPVAAVGFPATSGNNSSGAAAFAAGGDHSAAILSLGKLRAWGINEEGALGDGTLVGKAKAGTTNLTTLNPSQVACGREFTLVLNELQEVFSAGDNGNSELGRTTVPALSDSPTFELSTMTGALKISAGGYFAMALHRTGTLYHWGNNNGLDGNGGGADVATATLVTGSPVLPAGTLFTEVACGNDHVLALTSTGQIYAWGNNSSKQLSTVLVSSSYSSPQLLALGTTFRAVAAGDNHSLAIDLNGNVWTWGGNSQGQLGRNDTTSPGAPAIRTFSGATGNLKAVAIAAGDEYSVVMLADGTVWTCGQNATGQLGLGDTLSRDEFTLVPGVSGVIDIAAGRQHTLLRK